MAKIKKLGSQISNLIAAGEVVERPSNIVKELIENSIDAQSKKIEIQVSQGGIHSIVIIDDGIGMDAEDAELSFERHATSKIKCEEDLWQIATMGFRGEALASISAVSDVIMKTNNNQESTEIQISYGTITKKGPTSTPQGTRIEIRNLFQKVPARFKYLKTPPYEFSLISDIVSKFALSYPNISFYLSHDGKQVLYTKGNDNLQEVIKEVYGIEVAKNSFAIDEENYDFKIKGYIVSPYVNRSNKYYITLFINNRMIRDYKLSNVIIQAYKEYLPKDRFPIVVLNITMDNKLIDVNVHPNKWEIRLSKEKQLNNFLEQTILKVLTNQLEAVNMEFLGTNQNKTLQKTNEHVNLNPMFKEVVVNETSINLNDTVNRNTVEKIIDLSNINIEEDTLQKLQEKQIDDTTNSLPRNRETCDQLEENISFINDLKEDLNQSTLNLNRKKSLKEDISQEIIKFPTENITDSLENSREKVEEKEVRETIFDHMQVIGQFRNSYILAQGEKGLYVIDQHAAQERYHYEQMRELVLNGEISKQSLIIPIQIPLAKHIIVRIDEMNQTMNQIGIHFELFGEQEILIRELPIWMKNVKEIEFIQDMIEQWMEHEQIDLENLRHLAIATMACHSSIRFHRRLNIEEMKQVILDLKRCKQPYHCPHGRPTFICIQDAQLVKEFLR